MTNQQALSDLRGKICRGCGQVKKAWKSHCSTCYYQLPRGLQRGLYQEILSGYLEAYIKSLEYLKAKESEAA